MAGCDAVHINLSPATEYTATSHVIEVAQGQLERIGYVTATTLSEENRWFDGDGDLAGLRARQTSVRRGWQESARFALLCGCRLRANGRNVV